MSNMHSDICNVVFLLHIKSLLFDDLYKILLETQASCIINMTANFKADLMGLR